MADPNVNPETWIGPEVAQTYQRILTRLDQLSGLRFLRDKIVAFLSDPRLTFAADAEHWDASAAPLFEAGLIADIAEFRAYRSRLVPRERPVSFLAAPGSRMNDHHSYPGGLVFHTAADIELGLSFADVYQRIYQLPVDRDVVVVALVLHDIAKATVFQWHAPEPSQGPEQTVYGGEITIAGTGGHHIFAISEAIVRDFPAPVVQALAFCHNHCDPPEAGLANFLQAAYLLAGKPAPAGSGLTLTIADWICLLADSDWPLTSWAMRRSIQQAGPSERSVMLRALARRTEFDIFRPQT